MNIIGTKFYIFKHYHNCKICTAWVTAQISLACAHILVFYFIYKPTPEKLFSISDTRFLNDISFRRKHIYTKSQLLVQLQCGKKCGIFKYNAGISSKVLLDLLIINSRYGNIVMGSKSLLTAHSFNHHRIRAHSHTNVYEKLTKKSKNKWILDSTVQYSYITKY